MTVPTLAGHLQFLAQITGWAGLASPAHPGTWRVDLEDGPELFFHELDERALFTTRLVLLDAPETRDALCEEAARLQIMTVRRRRSVVALEAPGQSPVPGQYAACPGLICYRLQPLDVTHQDFLDAVTSWIDDAMWWRRKLTEPASPSLPELMSSDLSTALKL